MQNSIDVMKNEITKILFDNKPVIYLYGSVVLDDFKFGWSDIDILCLTKKVISIEQAEKLVNLRQVLMGKYTGNPYFRMFEGGFLSLNSFLNREHERVVYWGGKGKR
jgi:predicted nucleotidyltransferase